VLGIERQRGSQLRANTSITIMRAPQRMDRPRIAARGMVSLPV
jgi:hypothetical protein